MMLRWKNVAWVALAVSLVLLALPAAAEEDKTDAKTVSFASPELLKSAGKEMGGSCLYPSPVLFDIDGDGKREMIIGDLRGYLTVVKRTETGWGAESKLKDATGGALKFKNW